MHHALIKPKFPEEETWKPAQLERSEVSARRSAVHHGNYPVRNPEEDFCKSAQLERSESNPAVWGLSKRVRQPKTAQTEVSARSNQPSFRRRKLGSQHSMTGRRATHTPVRVSRVSNDKKSGGGFLLFSIDRGDRGQPRRMGTLTESPTTQGSGAIQPRPLACESAPNPR